uniref:VWFA domain-containing protein n=1 Tax=Entomoneis paludosa TaxID=265537 RepID=A0A7S3DR29_9STRA|mmetsp:Transcript_30041/g.62773  ORF Transcript_30041/g.62773 Transcript_30041/m.62773 type:complete len:692 (+) Transcript_30041:19-2094(+)
MNNTASSVSSSTSEEEDDYTDDGQVSSAPDEETSSLTQRYRLWIHGSNFPRQGRFGARVPSTYAMVTTAAATTTTASSNIPAAGVTLGQTEVVPHNCSPQWTSTMMLQHELGSLQYLFVHVFVAHHRTKGIHTPEKETERTLLGTARFEVGDILSTPHYSRARRLRQGGCVFCRLEPPRQKQKGPGQAQLVFSPRGGSSMSIQQQQPESSMSLEEEPVASANEPPNKNTMEALKYLRFRFAAHNLVVRHRARRSLLSGNLFHSLPDTIVLIAKRPATAVRKWVTVYRSQPVCNTLHPKWDLSMVELDTLCNGDIHQPIRISIMAVRPNRPPTLLGVCETTIRFVMEAATFREQQQQKQHGHDPKEGPISGSEGSEFLLQRSANKLKDVGRLTVLEASIVTLDETSGVFQEVSYTEVDETTSPTMTTSQPTTTIDESIDLTTIPVLQPPTQRSFRQLVQEDGCQINFCVAIDFTASNGDARQQSSLHYQSESLNDYEESIMTVGRAIQSYSQNQPFSVWGFGAKFRSDQPVQHLFQCGATPQVSNVDGILEAYRSVLNSGFIMSGPTIFLNVLQAAAVQAKKQGDLLRTNNRSNLGYTVLLVVTDGIMTDYEETLRKIRVYRAVPLSIIFVGVGRSDFASLQQLCGACPENTTFVEFRNQTTPAALAHGALDQLPRQISAFMNQHVPPAAGR